MADKVRNRCPMCGKEFDPLPVEGSNCPRCGHPLSDLDDLIGEDDDCGWDY